MVEPHPALGTPARSDPESHPGFSPAREAIFFTADSAAAKLSGLPAAGQSRLVADLKAPLGAGSLLAEALRDDSLKHSFDRDGYALTMFDRQLLRICQCAGIVCLPLQADIDKLLIA